MARQYLDEYDSLFGAQEDSGNAYYDPEESQKLNYVQD